MNHLDQMVSYLENGQNQEALSSYLRILNNGTDEEKFSWAEILFRYGFLDEPKELLEKLLHAHPSEGELLVFLAEILIEMGDEEEALLVLNKIEETDPNFPQALLLLADLYQMNGLPEVSEQKLMRAKKILPEEEVIDFALGELYSEQGKILEAAEAYRRVLEKRTEVAGTNVHQRMAAILSTGGSFEEALPYYEKALEEKLEINTLFEFAFTALQAGHHKTAIKKFEELKGLDREYHSLYLYLARAYEAEGETKLCYQTILEGIGQDEFNKDLYLYGGKTAVKLGEQKEAEKLFSEAIALDPGFTEAAINMNHLLLGMERYEEVLEVIGEMDAQNEEEPLLLWQAAISYQKLEEYSQALNKYNLAYTFFRDDEEFLTDYGYFLMEAGKREEAAEVFNKLLKKDPSNEEYLELFDRLSDHF